LHGEDGNYTYAVRQIWFNALGYLWQRSRGADVADPPPTRKVPVSVHELVRRIRDALPEWQQFKFTRNDPLARRLFGDYYIIDLRTHVPILEKDIEQLGRDLGVLKPWETLKSEAKI
jgi:hypothetical protein